jgi:hypothetical protein
VVDPRRTSGLKHARHDVLPSEGPPSANTDGSFLTPRADDGDHIVGFVALHERIFDRKQSPDLLNDRGEQLLLRRPACHERCDPPQRGLLLGEVGQVVGLPLGPGDRGEHVRRRPPAGHQRRDPPQRVLARSQHRIVLAQHLLGAQTVLDVGEGHGGAAALRHLDRHRHAGAR